MNHSDERVHVSTVSVRSLEGAWRSAMVLSGHELVGDEPPRLGGEDTGPSPFDLVAGGLAQCTNITLRMYAERKGWAVEDVRVSVDVQWEDDAYWLERRIEIEGMLDADQLDRMYDIARRTPVTLVLLEGMRIDDVHARA